MQRIPPIFVVSLPGSPRRERIARMLERWPGEWSFFDAVNGHALTAHERAALCDEARMLRIMGRLLAPGEIGCALSHVTIYNTIVARGLDRALVLEDDALPTDAFFAFPFGKIDWPFDVVSLETENALMRRRPEHELGGCAFHRVVWDCRQTVAYLVSNSGARILAAANTPIVSDSDWPVYAKDFRFYVADPLLAGHDVAASILIHERASMERLSPHHGAIPRRISQRFDTPLGLLFLRYLINRKLYDGVRDYMHREITPFVMRRLPYFYKSIRGRWREQPQETQQPNRVR